MKTIILIHGAWVTPACWTPFKEYFESLGYRVLAPAWPGKEGTVREQQKTSNQKLAGLGIGEIVEHYAKIIESEPEPPILIGHSFGGLFVQMLLDRGLGKMGIAIDPAPPKGVFAVYPSAIWSLRYPLLRPWKHSKILRWPFSHFQYAFVNTLTLEEQKKAYHDFVVPETARIFWQAALAPFNNILRVNFKNDTRAPLLIIAGEKDHIVPAVINRGNFKKYSDSRAVTDFKEFSGRTHWIIAQPGFEEVAGYCEEWIKKQS